MLDFEIGKILHAACQDGALSSTTAKSCSIFGLLPITRIGLWYVVFSFTGLRVSAFLVIPRSMVCASSFHTTLIIHFIYVYIYILRFCIYQAFAYFIHIYLLIHWIVFSDQRRAGSNLIGRAFLILLSLFIKYFPFSFNPFTLN